MAKISAGKKSLPNRIKHALMEGLNAAGIKAEVATEAVRTTQLHRVTVLANKFRELSPSERQNLVWRIVARSFTPEEQLLISMILTLAPDELRGPQPITPKRRAM